MSRISEKRLLLFQSELADSIVVLKLPILRLDGYITIILYFYNINIHLWIHGSCTYECEVSVIPASNCIQISMLHYFKYYKHY